MTTTRIPTTDLTGAALDWAVALASGRLNARVTPDPRLGTSAVDIELSGGRLWEFNRDTMYYAPFSPSTNWVQGGPIIEREGITTIRCSDDFEGTDRWCATIGQHTISCTTQHQQHDEMYQVYAGDVTYGPTPLIAAMRCFVRSRLGNHVDVPEGLL